MIFSGFPPTEQASPSYQTHEGACRCTLTDALGPLFARDPRQACDSRVSVLLSIRLIPVSVPGAMRTPRVPHSGDPRNSCARHVDLSRLLRCPFLPAPRGHGPLPTRTTVANVPSWCRSQQCQLLLLLIRTPPAPTSGSLDCGKGAACWVVLAGHVDTEPTPLPTVLPTERTKIRSCFPEPSSPHTEFPLVTLLHHPTHYGDDVSGSPHPRCMEAGPPGTIPCTSQPLTRKPQRWASFQKLKL